MSVLTGDSSGKVENVFDLSKINSEFAIGTALTQEASTFLSNRAQDNPKDWGSGGTYRLLFTALTGAMTGNLNGSGVELVQSAAASALQGFGAQEIKKILGDYTGDPQIEAVRTALQGIVGCIGGAATGNCGSGALGASASVVLGDLVNLASGKSASTLSQQDKDKLTNVITSIIASTAGSLGGDAAVASLAGRIEQENNQLVLPVPIAPPGGTVGGDAAAKKAADQLWQLLKNIFNSEDSAAQNPEQGQTNDPQISIDSKIAKQLKDRGWTEEEIKETVSKGPSGTSTDNRSAAKTPDGVSRNDPATVYGRPGEYIIVNDRTGEVVQVSDKSAPGWVDDSRINWR
jgi:filamentous hemagglutinin